MLGLTIGLGIAVAGPKVFGDDDGPRPAAGRFVTGEITRPEQLLPEDVTVPTGAGAASAEEAVVEFLDAEMRGDFAASFGYLADVARVEYGSPAGWMSAHADVLPPVSGYELGEQVPVDDGREVITTRVTLQPGLDQVVGLTAATAVVRWDVVRGEDGWGVSLESSPFEPVFPSDAGAVPAATSWAESRQRCETPANQFGGLVGSPSLARALCDTSGPVAATGPSPLDEAAGQPIFTAFGSDAFAAARVVRIAGPTELAAVLVPIGDEWTVIGVLP